MSLYQESPEVIKYGVSEKPNPYIFDIPTANSEYLLNFEVHSGGHNGTVSFDKKGRLSWFEVRLNTHLPRQAIRTLIETGYKHQASANDIIESSRLFPDCNVTPMGASFIFPPNIDNPLDTPTVFAQLTPNRTLKHSAELMPKLECDDTWRYEDNIAYRLKMTKDENMYLALLFGNMFIKNADQNVPPTFVTLTSYMSFGFNSLRDIHELLQNSLRGEIFTPPSGNELRKIINITGGIRRELPF